MTFDIAFVAPEEDLVLDPDGGPPTFTIAGGRAGNMTEDLHTRYKHLFSLE